MLTDQVGDIIYVRGDKNAYYKVARTDITNGDKLPAAGVIIKKWGFTDCLIQMYGPVEGIYAGLTSGKRYWVGDDGKPTNPAPEPVSGRLFWQTIGRALDDEVLFVDPGPMYSKRN